MESELKRQKKLQQLKEVGGEGSKRYLKGEVDVSYDDPLEEDDPEKKGDDLTEDL